MNVYCLIILSFFLSLSCVAQPASEILGGRSAGMGYVSATLRDSWSVFHNPAGLNGVENASVSLAYTNRYNVESFRTMAIAGVIPFKNMNAGVGISRFGDRLFSESRLAIGAATHLSGVDIGARIGYVQIMTLGLETRGLPFIDFGVITQLTDELSIGASLHHINQPQVTEFEDERLPALVRAGIRYNPVERFNFYLETQKENAQKIAFQAGVEYELIEGFFARTGLSSEPQKAYFGLGGFWKNITLDYAFNTHPRLGLSHQISVSYKIESKQTEGSLNPSKIEN